MRPFLAISLVVMTGCGDNIGTGEDGITPPDEELPLSDNGAVAKLHPEVCAVRSWDTVTPVAKDVDLAVVQMPQGAGILSVPKAGGDLRGFLTDARGLIMGEVQGIKVRTDGVWNGVSASNIDGRLVVGLTDGRNTSISVVRDDLGDYRELAVLKGGVMGDAPLLHSRDARVAATGGEWGVVSSTFDQSWAAIDTNLLQAGAPTSMTTATYGGDAVVAWSTESTCNFDRLAAATHSEQQFACANSRIAMNFAQGEGLLVYENRGGTIGLSDIRVNTNGEIANKIDFAKPATSPRVLFDGERFWVSYIDVHGDIVVGYMGENHSFVSTALELTRPEHDAYELALINGEVWVYSLDRDTGYGAHQLCLTR